jgi:FMN-dependent oxidoreductase (nitrilotriacetate monooxygenase family)
MYHLAWFFPGCMLPPFDPTADGPWTGTSIREWPTSDLYIDTAKAVERGGFSFILMEDTPQLDDHFGGTAEMTLRRGFFSPKFDPIPVVTLMSAMTRHIGIATTVSSTFWHPYHAARTFATLDHLSEGRIGLNLVTSVLDIAARNFGLDKMPPKTERYAMANEWIDVFRQLEGAWEVGAVKADIDSGIYADYRKVHTIDYVGKYFKCRGPLNVSPGPQRHIPMVEAGNSPAGRDLAARQASVIIGNCLTVEDMKELRADMTARVRSHGRDPKHFKTMFLCEPILGATDDEAKRRYDRMIEFRKTPKGREFWLWYLDKLVTGVDFSRIDLDMTVGDLKRKFPAEALISTVDKMFRGSDDMSLRNVLAYKDGMGHLGLIGSPETVARKMDELMEDVGGDGFLFHMPVLRHTLAEMCDGLCPVLRRRGSIRDGYQFKTFKENLLAF